MPAAVRKVTNSRSLQDFSLHYGEPLGDAHLRRLLAKKLSTLNVHTVPEHIITTVGATHALDIVSRTLLRPGDPVMVEEPGWAVEFARLAALGMRILPVPRRADGPDLEVMARYCEVHQPKLYVSVSVFHNPTGYCLSPGSAHRVLQLANQHNFHVVEDDTYSHIAPEHATRLTALDGLHAHHLCERVCEDSGAQLAHWLPGGPARIWWSPCSTPSCWPPSPRPALLEKALALCIEQGPAAPPCRAHPHSAWMPARVAQRQAGAAGRLQLCGRARGPVRLGGYGRGHRRAGPAHAGRGLPAGARRAVPCRAPAQHAHAHQLPTTQDAAFWQVFQRVVAQSRSR